MAAATDSIEPLVVTGPAGVPARPAVGGVEGDAAPPPNRGAVVALTMSTVAFTICFACWVLNAVLVTHLVTSGVLALDATQVGWLLAAPVLTGALSRLPLGLLTDRFGGRAVFTALMVFSALPMFAVSLAGSFTGLLLAGLGFGLVGGAFAVGVGYVSLWFPRHRQGTALGIFGMGNVGAALTTLGAPHILAAATAAGANPEGWRDLPRIYAVVLVVTAVVFLATTTTRTMPRAGASTLRRQLEPLRDVVVWRFGLYYALVLGAFVALSSWLVPYAVSAYEITVSQAGVIAAAFILPSGLVRAGGGVLSDRFGPRTVMYAVFLGGALVCLLLSVPKMDLRSPGKGVTATVPGTVTSVSAGAVQVGGRGYPIRPAPAGSSAAQHPGRVLPSIRSWQEPVVAPGDHVQPGQLLARGVTTIAYPANLAAFVALAFVFGVLTGIGSAGVYRFIPDHYPQAVGVVGGMVGVLGALGGFALPLLFGYLLRWTGLWSSSWLVLAALCAVCLAILHRVTRRIMRAEAPNLAELLERRPRADAIASVPGEPEGGTGAVAGGTGAPVADTNAPAVTELLKRVSLFAGLSAAQLTAIAGIVEHRAFPAEHTVFAEGDPGELLYVLVEGRVRVLNHGPGGDEIELTTLASGAAFGELALIDGSPRSATVRTLEACRLLVIQRASFLELLSSYPRLLADVLVDLSATIRRNSRQVFDLAVSKERVRAEQEIDRHRSLVTMVAGLAHEINTPIGVANHAASIVVERLTADELVEQMAVLSTNAAEAIADAREAAALVGAHIGRTERLVRMFKQLSVQQVAADRAQVDLAGLTGEVVELYRLKAVAHGLSIDLVDELPFDAPLWDSCPADYVQVLLNLLTNIERYAYPAGVDHHHGVDRQHSGGRVEIRLAYGAGAQEFRVTVRDFGAGIPTGDRERIFEPFFTTGRPAGGTGLGLSIVRSIVTSSLGGEIQIRAIDGPGACFVLRLPAVGPQLLRTREVHQ